MHVERDRSRETDNGVLGLYVITLWANYLGHTNYLLSMHHE